MKGIEIVEISSLLNCIIFPLIREMLKRGYIAGNSMYPCIYHTDVILDNYFQNLDEIFADIRDFEDGKDVMKSLDGPICQSGFKRLN